MCVDDRRSSLAPAGAHAARRAPCTQSPQGVAKELATLAPESHPCLHLCSKALLEFGKLKMHGKSNEGHCPNPVPLTSSGTVSVLPKLFVIVTPQAGHVSKYCAEPNHNMPSNLSGTARKFLGLAGALVVSAIALWGLMLFRRNLRQTPLSQSAQVSAADGVATLQELAEPWSSKTFIFHRPETKENISSIVIRLPDSAPDQPGAYWAFSLQTPFGHCQLEYITDLQKLSYDYRFQAKHPMVGDSCSRAVFDPLQMADLPGGEWARGAIVKGYGFRPPLGIEIRIKSDQLVAAKME